MTERCVILDGTPGETDEEFADSLRAAWWRRQRRRQRRRPCLGLLADRRAGHPAGPAGRARGALPMPDDDVLADRYLLADAALPRRVCLVRGLQLGP